MLSLNILTRAVRACVVWASLWAAWAAAAAAAAAVSGKPPSPGLVGARNLAAALDCSGVLGFSSVGHLANSSSSGPLTFQADLSDRRGLGWSRHTGEFTCFCPGVYQIAFSGAGAQLSLKRRQSGGGSWDDVVHTGPGGGAHTLLLEMNVGDCASLWRDSGELLPNTVSFSAFRLAKK
ncbi:uncharacterized protein LOC126457463 isoform X1 [Schistocerca serialis cubense]|uniref:uncharacterized protein LOC126457463 isoform X1 n=1 Tax=Schistocerca serialis cubense TaxID=2023355 RepID=UPI00214E995D|nr:uncharacterized protein LOC126457463 isoform X1 [Schistocerca serialis cubense]